MLAHNEVHANIYWSYIVKIDEMCKRDIRSHSLSKPPAYIPDVHLIHDDLVITTDTIDEHLAALEAVMLGISENGLILNSFPAKLP